MKKALMLMTSVVFGTALIGCQSELTSQQQLQQSVTGTVAYRERILLPDNAVVTVRLQDTSLADAPAVLLAEQVMETKGAQIPFSYQLSYDAETIKPGHTYSVSARIEVDGKLRFITDTAYRVITDENSTHRHDLLLVGVR